MRWRVTLRNDDVELRGYVDMDLDGLKAFSVAMKPWALVIASPADDDYNPFQESA